MIVDLKRRRFTVEEYHRMAEVGILTTDDRVELIDGEIAEMSPIGPRHAMCVIVVNRRFISLLEDRALVSVQGPSRRRQTSFWSSRSRTRLSTATTGSSCSMRPRVFPTCGSSISKVNSWRSIEHPREPATSLCGGSGAVGR